MVDQDPRLAVRPTSLISYAAELISATSTLLDESMMDPNCSRTVVS